MAVWPAGLQQRQFTGITETRQNAQQRSVMDTGQPKVRKRFTAAIRNVNIPVVFSMADRATFDTFYITTLGEGVLPFDWTDPVDDSTTVSFRFVKPPTFIKDGGLYTGTLNLEILPS